MIRLFCIIVIMHSAFMATVCPAVPWVFEGQLDPAIKRAAKKRFKGLDSAQSVTTLLKFLGKRLFATGGIEAIAETDRVVIRVVDGSLIKRIRVLGEKLSLQRPMRVAMQDFHGKLYNERVEKEILQKARKIVEENGYFRAQLGLVFDEDSKVATLRVDPKKPCVVHGLKGIEAEDAAEFVSVQLIGEVCNVKELERTVAERLRDLRDRGYFYQTLKVDDIRYFPDTNSAEIDFTGRLGTQSRFKVIERGAFGWLKELFSGDLYEGLERLGVPPVELSGEIVKRLKLKGYIEANVDYKHSTSGRRETHTYIVTRGIRYKVSNVRFVGLGNYSGKKGKKDLGVQEFLSRRVYLSEERLERGSDSLESALRQDGYWQAVVSRPKINALNSEAKSASVLYDVETGPRYIYAGRRIHLNGKQELSKKLLNKIKKIKTVKLGKKVQEADRSDIQTKIFKLLRDDGYLYTKVKVEVSEVIPEYHSHLVDPSKGQPVFFEIKIWPRKRVKIGDIYIQGLDLTSRKVVERELLFAQGDFYIQEITNRTRSNLQALGVFTNVRIQLDDPDMQRRSARVNMLVDLNEVLPGNVSFGPGWSRLDGTRFQAESSYLNLGGTNRQFFFRGEVSQERRQKPIKEQSFLGRSISTGYTEPWLLGLPVDLLLTASHQGSALDFWSLDYISEIALRYKFRWFLHDTSITSFLRQKTTREIGTNVLNDTLVSSGDVRIASYGVRLRTDLRNDRSWPTFGLLFEGQVDQAMEFLGGNTAYTHYDLLLSGYYPLAKNLSLAVNFHSTHFNKVERSGTSADVLPSAERVYLGGSDTVRGFEERSLGPFVDGVDADFGASHRNITKLELRYRLFKQVGVTGFMDFGNLYFSDDEETELGSILNSSNSRLQSNRVEGWYDFLRSPEKFWKDQYVSYGLGFNAITPLGSLNFAYGIPVSTFDDQIYNTSVQFCGFRVAVLGRAGSCATFF